MDFNECMSKKTESMSVSEIKGCINKLVYDPQQAQKDKELLSIVVLRKKAKHFDFLEGYTRWRTVGSWREIQEGKVVHEFPEEKNVQLDIEFKDKPDESVGTRLMELFKEFNTKEVDEELLYARTVPIEESSL